MDLDQSSVVIRRPWALSRSFNFWRPYLSRLKLEALTWTYFIAELIYFDDSPRLSSSKFNVRPRKVAVVWAAPNFVVWWTPPKLGVLCRFP